MTAGTDMTARTRAAAWTGTAAVAGGGIGGLAAAIALAQRGWRVRVFERQSQPREAGAGITFSENGLRVLQALDTFDEAMEGANRGTGVELRGPGEDVLDSTPLPAGMRLLSSPRAQVLRALQSAAARAGVAIETGREAVSATAEGTLRLADGGLVRSDLVVGADGVWSTVRRSLGIATTLERTTEGALRTIVPAEPGDAPLFERGRHIEAWRGNRRFLLVPLGRGLIYLALTCPQDDTAGTAIPVDVASWSATFPAWAHLLARIGAEVTWNTYAIVKTRCWSVGRTAIVGDAAHAQPPNLGQGGGMAAQNALGLAVTLESITDPRDLPDALILWETLHRPLTEHCQRWSVLYGEIAQLDEAVRARLIRGAMADPWLREQLILPARTPPTGTRCALPPDHPDPAFATPEFTA